MQLLPLHLKCIRGGCVYTKIIIFIFPHLCVLLNAAMWHGVVWFVPRGGLSVPSRLFSATAVSLFFVLITRLGSEDVMRCPVSSVTVLKQSSR